MPETPHDGQVPWAPYSYSNAHRAALDNGWQLFVVKIQGRWSWNVNAPTSPAEDLNERQRLKEAEGRCGTLERGKTVRHAKKAAEEAALRCGIIT